MKLYMLEPEVAGEIGENTVYDNFDDVRYRGAYPQISHLHFIFSGWLGDDIIESTPCFIVTDELKSRIEKSELDGCQFEDVEVSLSGEFMEMYPNRSIPKLKRLIPNGSVIVEGETYSTWSGQDFNLSNKSYLIVSENALDVLKEGNIDNCDLCELNKKLDV